MSIISSTHDFTPFVAGKTEPLEGQRLAKVSYKQTEAMTTKGEIARKPIAVSIPQVTSAFIPPDMLHRFIPFMLDLCETTQDLVIKGLYESGKMEVHDYQISLQALLKILESERNSFRMSSESVTKWCESSGINDALRLRLASILGIPDTPTSEQEAQVEAQVRGYTVKFAALAGSKTYYEVSVATKLLRALELAIEYESELGQDAIYKRFSVRLQEMVTNPKQDDMAAL